MPNVIIISYVVVISSRRYTKHVGLQQMKINIQFIILRESYYVVLYYRLPPLDKAISGIISWILFRPSTNVTVLQTNDRAKSANKLVEQTSSPKR